MTFGIGITARRWLPFLLLSLPQLACGTPAAHVLPLFQSDDPLKAVLTAPIGQAYSQKSQEVRLYIPGQWTYEDEAGATQRLDVSIRTRGNFRREYCTLPPLQLNFKKKQVEGTLFAGQNKLKLVAPCRHGARHQQYVILEYLAYRTFEILTERSFRTRLLRLSYVDSEERRDPWTDFAFVIEDDADMAERLGLERLRQPIVRYRSLDHAHSALVHLFQFLIANSDYSVLKPEPNEDCCHNTELLGESGEDGARYPIPFDFDMSGLVNADYAEPPSRLPIRDVRVRYYFGLCEPPDIFAAAIRHVQSKRDEIIELFRNSAELDRRVKSRTIAYLEAYFEILDKPNRVKKEMTDQCRGQQLLDKMIAAPKDPT